MGNNSLHTITNTHEKVLAAAAILLQQNFVHRTGGLHRLLENNITCRMKKQNFVGMRIVHIAIMQVW